MVWGWFCRLVGVVFDGGNMTWAWLEWCNSSYVKSDKWSESSRLWGEEGISWTGVGILLFLLGRIKASVIFLFWPREEEEATTSSSSAEKILLH